jgi:molecular chaperone IbpA
MSNQLIRFDTNALNRTLVGFDQIFSEFENRFASQVQNNYPPYNVIKVDEDHYEIELAVAGFQREEIELTVQDSHLIVSGIKKLDHSRGEYIHRGLAFRDFERYFRLTNFLEVTSAEISDGLLKICLERNVPEAMMPKKIAIK